MISTYMTTSVFRTKTYDHVSIRKITKYLDDHYEHGSNLISLVKSALEHYNISTADYRYEIAHIAFHWFRAHKKS